MRATRELVVVVGLALAACGGSDGDGKDGPAGPVDAPLVADSGTPAADAPAMMQDGPDGGAMPDGGATTDGARDVTAPPVPDGAAPPALTAAPAGTHYVYVGSNRGIDIVYLDGAGALTAKSWVAWDPGIGFMNASFMTIADRIVYVVSDAAPAGQIATRLLAFQIEPATGALSLLNHVSTGGPQSVHVSLDKQRRRAFVVNFQDDTAMPMRADTNTVAAFSLMPDGRIGAMLGGLTKAGKNPHAIYFPEPPAKLAFVPSLLDGNIGQFKVGDMGLTEPDLSFSLVQPAPDGGATPDAGPAVDAGTAGERPPAACTRSSRNLGGRNPGPRHMEFSGNGKYAYLLTEFEAHVNLFEVGASDGKLQGSGLAPVQRIDLVPPAVRANVDFTTLGTRGAEVFMHPSGKWLFASVRLDRCDYNSAGTAAFQPDREEGYVTRFAVANDGKLSDPQYTKVNREPRFFTFTPDGNFLIVAGQQAIPDTVLAFKVDPATGKLVEPAVGKAATGKTWTGTEPNQARSLVVFKKP